MRMIVPLMVLGFLSWLTAGCGGGPTAEPELHLLPSGFRGEVALRHQVEGMAMLAYEGKARVYEIPQDGQLSTASKANHGIRPPQAMRYFFVDAQGTRLPIPVKGHDRIDDPKTVCIIGGYQVGTTFYYFVDALENAGKYKNPAVNGTR